MLSDKAIQALRPDPSRSGTKHHDRDGLYLWVARSGSKTWRKDYRWEGVRQTFTIGTYPKLRLADARKVAMQINDWLRDGIDPRTQSSRQRRERERPEAKPLMMLTLVRPSELREACWGEVDPERRQWIIPAKRMKGRVRHIVPLSSQALLLFQCQRQITGHTELVFHTPNHRGSGGLPVMSNGCLSMLLRRMGFQGRQTPHGFRGFGQTNCIEQLKIARVVTEKQLAHADGNKVSRAYDWAEYLEERTEMMQRWADLLDQVAVNAGLPPVAGRPQENDPLVLLAS